MRRTISLFVLIFVVICTSVPSFALQSSGGTTIPDMVIIKANEGLAKYKSLASANPGDWGLAYAKDAESATLGAGFEIYYIGDSILTTHNTSGLLTTRDTSLYPTWEFLIVIAGQPKSTITICKEDGIEYQLSRVGGEAEYFAVALGSWTEKYGSDAQPILMKYRSQYFLVHVENSQEEIIPVPFDDKSSRIVASGQGIVSPGQVITAVRESHIQPTAGGIIYGTSYIDIWKANPNRRLPTVILFYATIGVGIIIMIGAFYFLHRQAKR
jgi:hypothetical protein